MRARDTRATAIQVVLKKSAARFRPARGTRVGSAKQSLLRVPGSALRLDQDQDVSLATRPLPAAGSTKESRREQRKTACAAVIVGEGPMRLPTALTDFSCPFPQNG
jgi:hypothetical protein